MPVFCFFFKDSLKTISQTYRICYLPRTSNFLLIPAATVEKKQPCQLFNGPFPPMFSKYFQLFRTECGQQDLKADEA